MDWRKTLNDLSFVINTSVEENMIYYDKAVIINNWLGFDGVSDSEIEKKEKELGLTLSKSYKDFLNTSNGFRQISPFTGNLLSVESIDWLKNSDQDFIDIYDENEDQKHSESEYYDYNENSVVKYSKLKI